VSEVGSEGWSCRVVGAGGDNGTTKYRTILWYEIRGMSVGAVVCCFGLGGFSWSWCLT
jgi:hypothetical protein